MDELSQYADQYRGWFQSSLLTSVGALDQGAPFRQVLTHGWTVDGQGRAMQKLSGNGVVFLEFDGYIKEYELAPGQQIIIDTGYLAAMTPTCSVEIQTVPGVKNILFGGEGFG